MKRLIVNADGFGFTAGINQGIFESAKSGIVTSTSCNVNFPYIDEVPKLLEVNPKISIGLHLNINVGKPVSLPTQVSSLVDSEGEFWGNNFQTRYFAGKIKLSDVEKELEAQIQKLFRLTPNISHLDGHQNKHLLPGYFGIVLRLGEKYGIKRIRCHRRYMYIKDLNNRKIKLMRYYLSHPLRIFSHSFARFQMAQAEQNGFKMADRLITPAYVDKSFKYCLDTWVSIMRNLPDGVNEIYCHPGYSDDVLRKYAKYVDERESEIKIMTNPYLRKCIDEERITLISFNEV